MVRRFRRRSSSPHARQRERMRRRRIERLEGRRREAMERLENRRLESGSRFPFRPPFIEWLIDRLLMYIIDPNRKRKRVRDDATNAKRKTERDRESRLTIILRPIRRIFDILARKITRVRTESVESIKDAADEAYRTLSYSDAPARITLATHDVCRSSRMFRRWTPNDVGRPMYFAYTTVRDDRPIPTAFPTEGGETMAFPAVSIYMHKWFGVVYTSIIELIRRLENLAEDRAVIRRGDDGAPKRSLPAVIAAYLWHRVLMERAKAHGFREDVDTMIHCSVYTIPTDVRPIRRKRGYRFTEACVGRFCVRRIRIPTNEVIE